MRRSAIHCLELALAVAFGFSALVAEETERRPNVVVILADDLGWSDVGCYGGEIPTPSIDRLADQGLRFRSFYSCGLCGPTRAALMTGLWNQQTGVRRWTGTLHERVITLPEVLKASGYRTMMVGRMDMTTSGKWHDPAVAAGAFDGFFGSNGHKGPGHYSRAVKHSQLFLDGEPYDLPKAGFFRTDVLTDYAVRFVEDAIQAAKPFFLYAAYSAPHWPLQAREADIAPHRDRYRKLGWDACREGRRRRATELGLLDSDAALPPRDPRVEAWDEAAHKKWEAERMAVYAAQVAVLDRGIGRIVKAIDDAGIAKNTLILFLSDNGASDQGGPLGWFADESWRLDGQPVRFGNDPSIFPGPDDTFASYGPEWAQVSNAPFRGYKGSLTVYEGGIVVPFIARWPGVIRGGGVTRAVGHVIDVIATALDVAGIEHPSSFRGRDVLALEGKSLLPVFRGQERRGHGALFWEQSGHRAVREGDWKLVRFRDRPAELYDLSRDPTELENLAAREPGRVRRLKARLERWLSRCEADAGEARARR